MKYTLEVFFKQNPVPLKIEYYEYEDYQEVLDKIKSYGDLIKLYKFRIFDKIRDIQLWPSMLDFNQCKFSRFFEIESVL